MTKRNLIILFTVIVLLIVVIVTRDRPGYEKGIIVKLSPQEDAYNAMDLEMFMAEYESHKSNMDFLNDIDIVMEETRIVYNATSPKRTVDNEKCTMRQEIRFHNKTDRFFKAYVKCFVPDELYYSVVYAGNTFGSTQFCDVNPYKGMGGTSGALLKHDTKMTAKEKDIYEAYKNDLYILLAYEGNEYYIKVDDLKVVEQ